jgi:hypothetical protein
LTEDSETLGNSSRQKQCRYHFQIYWWKYSEPHFVKVDDIEAPPLAAFTAVHGVPSPKRRPLLWHKQNLKDTKQMYLLNDKLSKKESILI